MCYLLEKRIEEFNEFMIRRLQKPQEIYFLIKAFYNMINAEINSMREHPQGLFTQKGMTFQTNDYFHSNQRFTYKHYWAKSIISRCL